MDKKFCDVCGAEIVAPWLELHRGRSTDFGPTSRHMNTFCSKQCILKALTGEMLDSL